MNAYRTPTKIIRVAGVNLFGFMVLAILGDFPQTNKFLVNIVVKYVIRYGDIGEINK